MSIRVSIIGATGYTGRELIRYLINHPEVVIQHCTSDSHAGKSLITVAPELAGRAEYILERCDVQKISEDTDLVFVCLPHGTSAKTVKKFLNRKIRVIDLSADYRLKSAVIYRQWYGLAHPHPELLKKSIYGLPEINKDKIKNADLIANPGCYATATLLAALPLVRRNLIRANSLIVDAKSGISGAGKKLESRYLFCESNENFLAYAVANHRHQPEMEQELKSKITFVPYLLPVNRGILATVYADLRKKMSTKHLLESYVKFYEKEPFVQILPQGSFPEIKAVRSSNYCQIGIRVEEKRQRAIVIAAIDNLGKGASGQAVQNMNLMLGMDEKSGLV